MRNIISLIVALLLLSIQHVATAGGTSQAASKFIEGSYIVTFRSVPEIPPIIQPPIKDNRNKVPFGEHSTGQNKADLAAELNTTGTVVSIYETINAEPISKWTLKRPRS